MRKYFEIEDELLEAKADEKPVTFFIVYRTWNEKNFNHIPSDGLVMSIIPTSYKTVKLAIKNKEKFATVPFIANSLDKIEIYEVLDDMTMGDYKSLKHYERESLLTKCKLVYEEDLRNKNEEYERGYRAGRREALRLNEDSENKEDEIVKLAKRFGFTLKGKHKSYDDTISFYFETDLLEVTYYFGEKKGTSKGSGFGISFPRKYCGLNDAKDVLADTESLLKFAKELKQRGLLDFED